MRERIACDVLQALPDLIIVSYENSQKQTFQGALLKISNKISPFEGFQERLKANNPRDYLEETFSTVSKRYTYFQNQGTDGSGCPAPAPQPGKRLGVRLRARQVTCNKCKSICTENGETVQPKTKSDPRKSHKPEVNQTKLKGRNLRQPKSESVDELKLGLVPKLRRLDPGEIEKFSPPKTNREENQIQSADEKQTETCRQPKPLKIRFTNFSKLKDSEFNEERRVGSIENDDSTMSSSKSRCSVDATSSESDESLSKTEKVRNLRKKRGAVSTVEDSWEETVFEESRTASSVDFVQPAPPPPLPSDRSSKFSTPVLKISFGTLGQGTVLKIPSKSKISEEVFENDENCHSPSVEKSPSGFSANRSPRYVFKESSAAAKAAKKALKRARKEAARRAMNGGVSPLYFIRSSPSTSTFGGYSPAAAAPLSSCSPSAVAVSPVQAAVFENDVAAPPPETSPLKHKKHKRKKHKKKKTSDSNPSCELPVESKTEIATPGERKLSPGTVVWAKTVTGGWWPAKVRGSFDSSVEVLWYSSETDESSTVVTFSETKSFVDSFQEFVQLPLENATFETAVRLACQDVDFIPMYSGQTFDDSPRAVDCLS